MKRILCAATKGGVGKTTLCRNVAAAAARDGLTVLTADLDPQRTLTAWSRRRPEDVPKIKHYPVEWPDAEALLDDGELAPGDVLLIDTPPSIEAQPVAFKALIAGADLIMVPTRPTFDDAESVAPFLALLRDEGRPSFSVLNAVKPRVNITSVKNYLLKSGDLCPVEVADRTDFARAGMKGLGLVDLPGHAGGEEINAVWSFIKNRLGMGRKAHGRKKA